MDMGFTKDQSITALKKNKNKEAALEYLLTQGASSVTPASESKISTPVRTKGSSRKTSMDVDENETPRTKKISKEKKRQLQEKRLRDQKEREKERERLLQELNVAEKKDKSSILENKRILAEQARLEKEKEEAAKKLRKMEAEHQKALKRAQEAEESRRKKEERERSIKDIAGALKLIRKDYGVSRTQLICRLLTKILKKIIDNADEEKYRTISLDNQKIQKAFVRPLGGMVIMKKLGFVEENGKLVMHQVRKSILSKALARFEKELQTTVTVIPELVKRISQNQTKENIYFALVELRNTLANVVSFPEERNFRSIDITSSMYINRLAIIPEIVQIFKEFGYKPEKNGIFLVVEDPDVSMFEAGYNDASALCNLYGPQTDIYVATGNLLEENKIKRTSKFIEKLGGALKRVIDDPHEQKYHKINLQKFLANLGDDVNGFIEFLRLFSFKVHKDRTYAKLTYPGYDLELLQLRYAELNRSWNEVLPQYKKRKIEARALREAATVELKQNKAMEVEL